MSINKGLLDMWHMTKGGLLVVSRKDDWRLHAIFTKEELKELYEYLKPYYKEND